MVRILEALGFVRTGKSYPRRNERLGLFLRARLTGPLEGVTR